jgi:hypothetical protein
LDPAAKPSVLFVYFTFTSQKRKVIDVMAEVLRGRGCDVTLAPIEFYSEVSPELRRVRGPYLVADGIAAYVEQVGLHGTCRQYGTRKNAR